MDCIYCNGEKILEGYENLKVYLCKHQSHVDGYCIKSTLTPCVFYDNGKVE